MFAGKKSAQIREILISESAWEEMTCLFAPSLSEMFRTMTAIGNGSFAGNRFIPLALVLLTLALASPF
ncbi:hypothetical protein ACLH1R_27150, partial [Klebsiella sp. 1SOBk13mer]